MRKTVFFLALLVMPFVATAQKIETNSEFPTGYLTTSNYDESNTIKSIDGVLYMILDDIPIALIKYPPLDRREEYEIPATVRRICNNAFQGTKYLKTLKFHNVITEGRYISLTIGESAFNDSSIESFVVIENDQNTLSQAPPAVESSQRNEVGRYNTLGYRTDEKNEGMQIVVYDNKTTKKIIK